nr:MAG TPA: hypothetical protein [Caudoviricetes sp.]
MICNNIHTFRLFSFLSQKFLPVTVSLCLLFSIPGKYFTLFPLYLNSLNIALDNLYLYRLNKYVSLSFVQTVRLQMLSNIIIYFCKIHNIDHTDL